MKLKVLAVVLAVLVSVSFGSMVFAQEEGRGPHEIFAQKLGAARLMNFEGAVLSHDVACHCIVVKTGAGDLVLQDDYAKYDQEYNRAAGVKAGAKVKGTYKTVDYINYALDIHIVK